MVGICLIALGALVACPTEDDNEDDGGLTATFAAATSTITEEDASGTIGVALDADAGADGVAVQFGVVPTGTTAEDDDWQITTGGSSGVVEVPGSANRHTLTITDNDAAPAFSGAPYTNPASITIIEAGLVQTS